METSTIISLAGVCGSALLALGIWLGTLRSSTRSAHKRIDDLEDLLRAEFRGLRTDLRDSIERAWMNCPLAHKGDHDK